FDFTEHPHRRYNPLTRSWVLCSPHRAKRPWLGQKETVNKEVRPEYLPDCYLCPRNKRAVNDTSNPDYKSTYVFPNDYPAVLEEQPDYNEEASVDQLGLGEMDEKAKKLFQVRGVRGNCHVVCFTPKHNVTLAEMTVPEIKQVVDTWADLYQKLGAKEYVNYVQMFENKGSAMGCSNPHPHGQIWSLEDVPEEPSKEIRAFKAYREENHSCLLCDYTSIECKAKARVVCENDSFLCVTPFWAVWPYEALVVSKQHVSKIPDLNESQRVDLADIIRRITCRYDNLFECSFPYSMGIHQAPVDNQDHSEDCHLHLHFYPPLLRSATVRKFLVGFEMLGEPQRDITAEQAAERLRACSETHY
ncbi:galactose-1-phosphate uridylyltransferase, partial [Basidiobolus meristosporus CBS 931.73]